MFRFIELMNWCWQHCRHQLYKHLFENHIKPCIGRDYADIDECSLDNGGCGSGQCFNNEGSFTCDCPAGFSRDGDRCVGKSCYYMQCLYLSTPRFHFIRVYTCTCKAAFAGDANNNIIMVCRIRDIYNLQLILLYARLCYL